MRFAILLSAAVLSVRALPGAGVTARFDPSSPDVGPFPTDALTVSDPAQATGRRVNLPLPDCDAEPSSCRELALMNQLDGFNLQPRLRVRFSAPVDPATLRDGLRFIAPETGDTIGVNELVYDPATDTANAKPDHILDQGRRYALVVTDAVHDRAGDPVEADAAFRDCVQGAAGDYCAALADAVNALTAGLAPRRIVGAAVFTTLSATRWLESARAQLQNASLGLAMAQPRAVFRIADLDSVVLHQQVRADPVDFSDLTLPLDPILLNGVGRVAFGSYQSPQFLNERQSIAASPSSAALELPSNTSRISFEVYLPDSPRPAAGYPVVIFGHGLGDSRLGGPTAVAPSLARAGLATIAISAVGHGFGPKSQVILRLKDGSSTALTAGGRGVDLNGDGAIDAGEGCIVISPEPVGLRDCFRQTAVDLMQLVRVIRAGLDVDGDGAIDLDPDRIYYAGQSLGALYGTLLAAVEPEVRAAALNVGGGSVVELARWSQSYRPIAAAFLGSRVPSLLNRDNGYDDDYVLRDQPVKITQVPGAIAIQNLFERLEWLQATGDPVSFAPHLKSSPLAGVAAKPVLWQFARGDRTVPNPASSSLIRAAGMAESTWIYRHDRARAAGFSLPENPHPYLVLFVSLDGDTVRLPSLAGLLISLAAQQQIAQFLAADGAVIPDINDQVRFLSPTDLFEVPEKLPEDLNF